MSEGPALMPSFWFSRVLFSRELEVRSLEEAVESVLSVVESLLSTTSTGGGRAILGVFYIETSRGLYEARLWVFEERVACACNFDGRFNPREARRNSLPRVRGARGGCSRRYRERC